MMLQVMMLQVMSCYKSMRMYPHRDEAYQAQITENQTTKQEKMMPRWAKGTCEMVSCDVMSSHFAHSALSVLQLVRYMTEKGLPKERRLIILQNESAVNNSCG